jgi:D-3-phosphoglycerate dehydrogenase
MPEAKRLSILVADDLGDEGVKILERAGDVLVRTGMDEDALCEAVRGKDALVVRSATRVTGRVLECADRLAVVGRAGIGVDNIDVRTATERGVAVMNTPDAGAVTTAEHAIALVMALARNIPQAHATLAAGGWDKKRFGGVELRGKTLVVVGLGNIGRVAAELGQGLGMRIVAYDPFVAQDDAPDGVTMLPLADALARADFVTVHVPLLEATRHLLGREQFACMKKDARLVCAARGGILDEAALLEALDSGRIAGAALDVFETEPLPADSPLRGRSDLVLTPHLGASTAEAKRNVGRAIAEQIVTCLRTGVVLNGVNTPRVTPGQAAALGPFLDLATHLGRLLTQVFPGSIQSVRVGVQGHVLEHAGHAVLTAALAGVLQPDSKGAVTVVNAAREAERRGVRVHLADEAAVYKRDFVNLIRIEALIDDERHHVSGTVLGNRHGRLIELDGWILDAIPEGPLLVTFHANRPGVVGRIGTILGGADVNIERVQLGAVDDEQGFALGIFNLDRPLDGALREQIAAVDGIEILRLVQ